MRTVLAALIGVVALSISSLTAVADGKTCKPGYEYDEIKGKCVAIRGS